MNDQNLWHHFSFRTQFASLRLRASRMRSLPLSLDLRKGPTLTRTVVMTKTPRTHLNLHRNGAMSSPTTPLTLLRLTVTRAKSFPATRRWWLEKKLGAAHRVLYRQSCQTCPPSSLSCLPLVFRWLPRQMDTWGFCCSVKWCRRSVGELDGHRYSVGCCIWLVCWLVYRFVSACISVHTCAYANECLRVSLLVKTARLLSETFAQFFTSHSTRLTHRQDLF